MGEWEYLEKLLEESLELNGVQLAAAYCGACDLKPEPELLEKRTWETTVLPEMRRRLGLVTEEDFGQAVGKDNNAPPGVYSNKKLISKEQRNKFNPTIWTPLRKNFQGLKSNWIQRDRFQVLILFFQNTKTKDQI